MTNQDQGKDPEIAPEGIPEITPRDIPEVNPKEIPEEI